VTRTFKLNHTIAENVNAKPKDVLSAKRYLYDMGYYEPPQWGITEFPDRALIDAIRNFQRAYPFFIFFCRKRVRKIFKLNVQTGRQHKYFIDDADSFLVVVTGNRRLGLRNQGLQAILFREAWQGG